jgi:hypothetical protein
VMEFDGSTVLLDLHFGMVGRYKIRWLYHVLISTFLIFVYSYIDVIICILNANDELIKP